MKKAVIDLGSNSMLLLIAEKKQKQWQILSDQAEIVRLGEGMGLSGGALTFKPEALKRVEKTLEIFTKELAKYNVKTCLALTTAAARKASNVEDLREVFYKKNIELKVISGQEEARLTYLGANYELDLKDYCVLDIGGGSSEILWHDGKELKGKSLDMGAVQLSETFFKEESYSAKQIEAAEKYIKKQLATMPQWFKKLKMVSVAGTPTTLVSCEKSLEAYDRAAIHNEKLNLKQIKKWLDKFNSSSKQRLKIKGLDKKRADIIFAGTLIFYNCLNHFNCDESIVSCGGIRFGEILEE